MSQIEFTTFKPPEKAPRDSPRVESKLPLVRRYKITVEILKEPKQVIASRLRFLWKRLGPEPKREGFESQAPPVKVYNVRPPVFKTPKHWKEEPEPTAWDNLQKAGEEVGIDLRGETRDAFHVAVGLGFSPDEVGF